MIGLARWQVAAPPPSMRAGGGAHRHHLLLVCVACCGVTGGMPVDHESQSIDCTNALDHTNTCAHVNLEVKIGQNEYIVSLSLADSRSLTKFGGN